MKDDDRRTVPPASASIHSLMGAEGVIMIEPDQRTAWANQAALSMHGFNTLTELGTIVDDYRRASSFAIGTTARFRSIPPAAAVFRYL
jgi:predicted amidohydrolase YtcJ